MVTVSPDVSSSTNLGGWLNKVGVWSPTNGTTGSPTTPRRSCTGGRSPTGQHMELGIAETNLVGLIGELGATWSRWGQPLFPIGVLYDPFVERALEPWSYGIYAGGQSILVGTPSGVTPRPRGRGAPVDQDAVDRTRAAGLRQLRAGVRDRHRVEPAGQPRPAGPARTAARPTCGCPPGRSTSRWPPSRPTRRPGNAAAARWSPARTRCGAADGRRSRSPAWAPWSPRPWPPPTGWRRSACRRRRVRDQPRPAVPRRVQARRGLAPRRRPWILDQVFPADRGQPAGHRARRAPAHAVVPATINRVPAPRWESPEFGQSGALEDVYRYHGIDTDSIVRAALDLSP